MLSVNTEDKRRLRWKTVLYDGTVFCHVTVKKCQRSQAMLFVLSFDIVIAWLCVYSAFYTHSESIKYFLCAISRFMVLLDANRASIIEDYGLRITILEHSGLCLQRQKFR